MEKNNIFVIKRKGDIEVFDIKKIKNVLDSIYNSLDKKEQIWNYYDIINQIINDIENEIIQKEISEIKTTEINDIVWVILSRYKLFELAKQYILISEEKRKKLERKELKDQWKLDNDKLMVIKRNWTKEKFSKDKIIDVYNFAATWLKQKCKINEFLEWVRTFIVDNLETKNIYELMIKSCINNISTTNTEWNILAWRIKNLQLYKEASLTRKTKENDNKIYWVDNYINLIKDYVEKGMYDERLLTNYSEKDLKKAWKALNKKRDFEYWYSTMHMLATRYLLNPNKIIKELPQEMYMSIALFLALPEKEEDRIDVALKIYEMTSSQKISLPTPTLLNARTKEHQLSSCFITDVNDDLRDIYHNIADMAQISKNAGWLWSYWWNVRAKGSAIRWVEGASGWVIPWLKVTNDTAISCNQLGSRSWAISTTIDIFHADLFDFLDMQTETWDIRSKCFDLFPAISIPDLYMERVKNDEEWTIFCPAEIKKVTGKSLQDHFWQDFNDFYKKLENNTKLKIRYTYKAKDIFKKILKTVVETWMPYVFFRDTVNNVNPNKHCWNIYSTNLCTEIAQNMKPNKFVSETSENWEVNIKYEMWDMVTCNLASVNLWKVNKVEDIKETMAVITRILDNVITLNKFPLEEARITAEKYRSIGIWYMWLAEYLAHNKLSYEDGSAIDVVDELFENFSYYTLYYSNQLAQERWAYPLFEWSEWHKWVLMWKDAKWFEQNAKTERNWQELINTIQNNGGVRFWYHSSPAPNTSTAWVVGTTAWLVPIYKKYFIETNAKWSIVNIAPWLNEENFWHYKEYVNMKMPPIIDVISTIQKWIDQSISFEWMTDPATTSPQELFQNYIYAWEKWIKTVYYVRSLSLDVNEGCESCSW